MKTTAAAAIIAATPLLLPFTAAAFDYELGGHLRAQTVISHHDQDSLLAKTGDTTTFFDGAADGRLNSRLFIGDDFSFALAYEIALSGGETRRTLSTFLPTSPEVHLLSNQRPSDEQQLFSLTDIFTEQDELIGYHRLDRLFFAWDSDYGHLQAGRQALTWGNGMVFNPADLVNPFAPADIIRDYKLGTDMLLYQVSTHWLADFQLVLVPRRNIDSGNIDSAEFTFGAKAQFAIHDNDLTLMAVDNYGDVVLGTGLTKYVGDAVFRSDLTLTFLSDDPDTESYLSAVANMDYSWTWLDKNWYGLIELYYNGLGYDTLSEALNNPSLVKRLLRGELFVTGRYYLDAMLQYEAHPLLNLFGSIIINLTDGSFLFQPRLSWSVSESSQLLAGLNIAAGGTGSEFGSKDNSNTNTTIDQPLQAYLVLTWYF